jgi:cytochrome c-type biogenesis protein CcmE|tara:strand:- start:54 stop:596 length:543 start_codon:yes stop_codon:yes gene_type:complete
MNVSAQEDAPPPPERASPKKPMTRKRRRLYLVLAGMVLLGAAAALVFSALRDNLVFFYGPSELLDRKVEPGRRLRLGGLVVENSVERNVGDGSVVFRVTDLSNEVLVTFRGLLPDLFREGQGVVAEGILDRNGVFQASEVLAKHDENYMPPEVADALKKSGRWKSQRKGQEEDESGEVGR